MAKIQTFELDRWSEPDENHRVKHIGMADAKETFDKLKTHLETHGLLPDEYFLYSSQHFPQILLQVSCTYKYSPYLFKICTIDAFYCLIRKITHIQGKTRSTH